MSREWHARQLPPAQSFAQQQFLALLKQATPVDGKFVTNTTL